jgi:hypothetical protein
MRGSHSPPMISKRIKFVTVFMAPPPNDRATITRSG